MTPRWRPLRFHPEQCRLIESPARFKVVPAGRRSGKTELAKRTLVLSLWKALTDPPRPWSDVRFFAAAPTREQAKRIFWNDLKALVPPAWLDENPRESELALRTRWGAELRVVGLDRPQRIEGVGWDGGVIDELADCRPETFDAHVRPALADRRGWLWLIGVPDAGGAGQAIYRRLYDLAKSGTDPEWDAFAWPSSDILDAAEIESARRRMDERLFEQEYLGKFVSTGGRAFPDFDAAVHVSDALAHYDPLLPLSWSLDFNYDPMCSGILQRDPSTGIVRVIDEIVLPNSSTDAACTEFLLRCQRRRWKLDGLSIYGDASGASHRSVSPHSDWAIVRRRLAHVAPRMRVPRSNPPLRDTVNAVRALMRNADGQVRLYVSPRCHRLIDDLQTLSIDGDLSEGHCAAWLRYYADREHVLDEPANRAAGVAFL